MEDAAQKRRNMMLKNTARPNPKLLNDDDMKASGLVIALDNNNCPTTWVANTTCAYGNPIIAVFPRSFKKDLKKVAKEEEVKDE